MQKHPENEILGDNMAKKIIEAELTDEQFQKYNILMENGIDVGKTIDMLFEFKDRVVEDSSDYLDIRISEVNKEKAELEEQLAKVNKQIDIYAQLKDSTLDVDKKLEILEKDYGGIDESYDIRVQNVKHKVSWSKDFFQF